MGNFPKDSEMLPKRLPKTLPDYGKKRPAPMLQRMRCEMQQIYGKRRCRGTLERMSPRMQAGCGRRPCKALASVPYQMRLCRRINYDCTEVVRRILLLSCVVVGSFQVRCSST